MYQTLQIASSLSSGLAKIKKMASAKQAVRLKPIFLCAKYLKLKLEAIHILLFLVAAILFVDAETVIAAFPTDATADRALDANLCAF